MSKATTSSKVDYFRLPRPLWRKLKKHLPAKKRKSKLGGRPRASDRAVANAIWYVLWTGCQWKALHKDYFGVSSSVVHERFQKWRRMGLFEKLMRRMAEYYATERGGIGWRWQAMDSKHSAAPLGARKLARIPPTGNTRSEDEPPRRRGGRSHLGHPHWSQSPQQSLRRRSDRFDDAKAPGSQGAASVRRQSLRLRGRKGVRLRSGLRDAHQGQSQKKRFPASA